MLLPACAPRETPLSHSFTLTAEETEFIAAHRDSLRLGSDSQFAPIEFFDSKGQHQGIAADYSAFVEQRLGIRFQVVRYATFSELLAAARERKVDLVASMEENAERRSFLSFTPPINDVPIVFVTREDRPGSIAIKSGCDGCRVGVVDGYAVQAQIAELGPSFNLVPVSSEVVGLRDVAFGRLDAMAINLATASYHITNDGISNLRVAGDVGPVNHVAFGVRNDWPLLSSVVTKAVASISAAEREAITARWIRIDVPLWRQPRFWYALGSTLAALLTVFGLVVAWNRTLQRTVEQRTRELQKAAEQRSQLESELAQAQKMEALGRLAGGVAHDFNNLLTVILGHLDFVLEEVPLENPWRSDLTEVQQSAKRAAELTKQLLAFGRRQVHGSPVVLDLGAALEQAHRLVQRVIGEHIRIEVAVPEVTCWSKVDPTQLDQIVLNLAINARDAMPSGGTLRLSVRKVDLRPGASPRPGGWAVLEVSDTGVGMSDEVRSRLFEPFFTTKELGRGTGLGLSVVYGIVKQAEGDIEVTSAPGAGSTFTVWLPAHPAPSEGARSERPKAPRALTESGATILLVEDEEMVREVSLRILEEAGYRVLQAPSGDAAHAQFAGAPDQLDLLVTDVVMPGMDGRQLFTKLREGRPDLRVLYVSGYTADFLGHGALEKDGAALLVKPFSREALVSQVKAILARPCAAASAR
ncbi:MAG: transporter substrate-binding domain-containing protein [Myxococcales bacterium]